MMTEFHICQDHHTKTWFLFIAASRWFAYRLDFLCTLFVFIASFTPLLKAEKGGSVHVRLGYNIIYLALGLRGRRLLKGYDIDVG